jgi:erythromycin esterase-like protein
MLASTLPTITHLVREAAHPLTGSPADYDSLLQFIGDARFVLLGEAAHGTHEFYRERAKITQRLLREKGFAAIAVEADWPDAYRVHRYVQGDKTDANAVQAVRGFKRFPAWIWRNADVLDFIRWLRTYNHASASAQQVGFYGLDLYSRHASMECVLRYLDATDPDAAHRARLRYACFDQFGDDPQAYGYAAGLGLRPAYEKEAISQLLHLQHCSLRYTCIGGLSGLAHFFEPEQDEHILQDAEEHYRAMFRGSVGSWNLRDQHMAATFSALAEDLELRQPPAKMIVWAHNSHIGDARATQMGDAGECNLGQLIRQRYGAQCRSIGFTTYSGTVTAASGWGSPAERKEVQPARLDSYEALFHQTGIPAFSLNLEPGSPVAEGLRDPLLERAIGVVYLPANELTSHYFRARLSEQFDAIVHFDRSRAVEPLEALHSPAL